MSRVVGFFGNEGTQDCRGTLARMLDVQELPPSAQVHSGPNWALALDGVSEAPVTVAAGDALVAFLDPASEAAADTQRAKSLAHAIIAAIERDGPSALGKFPKCGMCIVLHPQARQLLIGVDHFGIARVFYAPIDGGTAFASDPAAVTRHPAVDDALDPQAIFDYLYATVVPAPRTVFASVESVLPGDALEVHAGRIRVHALWRPRFEPGPPRSQDDAIEELRTVMAQVVANAAAGCENVGCFLSGGIDSSTVTGLLAAARPGQVKAFSIGFEAEGYDELDYARLVAGRFGVEHHEYYVTPDDIISMIPRIARAYGQPFGNSSVVPAYHCARLAREHGVERLLAGDGGDELFGGNERYAQQWILGLYSGLPGWMRAVLPKVFGGTGNPICSLPLLSKACSYVRHASTPLPERLDIYNYLPRLGAGALLHERFQEQIDVRATVEGKRAWFDAAQADNDLDRMLALDYKVTLADNDLPKVTMMCAEAGVQVRFPFLAQDVVEFANALPAHEKVHHTQLRVFFKRAMSHLLPAQVLTKSKHGFGLPFGTWVTQHQGLRECVFDLLQAVRKREIVSDVFLRALSEHLLADQPRYYGPLVWVIIMLESWLEEHAHV